MNECPSPVHRRDGTQMDASSRNINPTTGSSRHHHHHRNGMMMMMVEDEIFGDPIKCTGKSCKSCTAGLIADCVAVCCCPCAVVNILVFAFLKVPWMVGRRILKKLKKKNKGRNSHLEKKMRKCLEWECGMEMDGISRKGMKSSMVDEQGALSEFGFSGFGDEEMKNNFSARFEADEQLWFEFHDQVGHLGFGRVSFTGIPIPIPIPSCI